MKRLPHFLFLLGLLATTLGVGPCTDQPLGSAAGAAGSGSAGSGSAGSGSAGSGSAGSGTVACDDGTGEADCCADPAISGPCANEGLTCWTPCGFSSPAATDGYRGHKFCGGGQWTAGLGLFPCSRAVADGGGAGAGTVACDDGTGATDCCADPSPTGACANEGLTCWTRCAFPSAAATDGYRGQKYCAGGQWGSGHGLFPCSRAASDGGGTASDGGAASSDGGSARAGCTFGADQTCNDDLTVSSLWGHCEPDGTCTCAATRAINPATGRCAR
jgi:hypothetical protein